MSPCYDTFTFPPFSGRGEEFGIVDGWGLTGVYCMFTPMESVEFLPPDPTSLDDAVAFALGDRS